MSKFFQKIAAATCGGLFMLGMTSMVFAATPTIESTVIKQNAATIANTAAENNQDLLNSARQELLITQQKNSLAQQRVNQLRAQSQQQINLQDITPSLIERAQLDAALASANQDGANIIFSEAQQANQATQTKITSLENQLQSFTLGAGKNNNLRPQIAVLQEQLNYQKTLSKLQQKELSELAKSQSFTGQIYGLLDNYKNNLARLHQIKLKQSQQIALQQQELELQKQQKIWLNKLAALNQQIQGLNLTDANTGIKQQLELDILQAQEQSNLIHLQLVILHLKEESTNLEQQQKSDVPGLNDIINQTTDMLASCSSLDDLISRKQKLLTMRMGLEKQSYKQNLLTKAEYEADASVLKTLVVAYQKQLNSLKELEQQIQSYLYTTQQQLNKAMARRQGLPGFSFNAWQSFGRQVTHMPMMATESVLALKDQIVLAVSKLNVKTSLIILFTELGWFTLWMLLKTGLTRYTNKLSRKRDDIAGNMLFIVLTLLKRNFNWIFAITALIFLLSSLDVTAKSFAPFIAVILVLFIFKIIIGGARLILLETSSTVSKMDRRLYQELKYGLIIGGGLTVFTVLAHILPVGYEVTDFANRLFMLFMLVISTLLLRSWKVVPTIVKSTVAIGRTYLMKVVNLLSFLVPLTFFSTALIGFLGYVDFAWTLSRYEGIFLLVISVYMLLRGLWNDIAEWLSEQCIKHFQHGWLVTQVFLRPFDDLVRVSLFVSIFLALFYLYGLNMQSYIIQLSNKILHFNLLQAKNAIITPLVIIEFVIAGIIIYWISRWTRELAFRWFFAKTQDAGLRNSLSAFSQYTVVLLGILLALQIIGVDLTGISYVLGGLAFGAAFGLRDLVKNYASGLLLLIERPVRTGDLVSVGNFEGEVTHIGMRSMTLKTWDHLEVLVPNSETFDKPFTNWTHLDSIVRSVINLKISRDDDPQQVKDLIFSVLKDNTYIVSEPEPQVYLMEMDDALMEFEVRYFINLQQGKSRPAIRSDVLFALFALFKQYNIKLPYPPQDLYVRSLPNV